MIDLKFEKAFFDEKGITATSANYLANMAKEAMQENQKFFDSLSLYSTDAYFIGNPNKSTIKKATAKEDFDSIAERIQNMCEYNAFIAWVREAIKEKDRMLTLMRTIDLDSYMGIFGIKLERPERPVDFDEADALRELNIGQRFMYLYKQACSSTYGQLIHPNRPISAARDKLNTLTNNPIEINGTGRDAIVKEYNFPYPTNLVDKLFFELQSAYRTNEKALNNMKHSIKERVFNVTVQRNSEYENAVEKYESERSKLYATFKKWQEEQINEIHRLKIVIPDNLQEVYQKLNKMGAEKA